MDTSRRFDSKVGAELWLEREGVEGQPILLKTYTDGRGRVIRKEWAIRPADGYMTVEIPLYGRLLEERVLGQKRQS